MTVSTVSAVIWVFRLQKCTDDELWLDEADATNESDELVDELENECEASFIIFFFFLNWSWINLIKAVIHELVAIRASIFFQTWVFLLILTDQIVRLR